MKKVKVLIQLLINLTIYFIANIVPKKTDLWVFGAWFGTRYSDNPKAFFEYINIEKKTIKAVWITKESSVVEQVRVLGFKAYHEKSIQGIWYQLRSKFVFICQAHQDDLYAPCIGSKTKVVNLWHGLPLKKIMYDVFGDRKIIKNKLGQLVGFLSPYEKRRNDYTIATSLFTQKLLANAFRIEKEKVLITGFPRNDVFLKNKKLPSNSSFKGIYMPTFRGGIGSECDLFFSIWF